MKPTKKIAFFEKVWHTLSFGEDFWKFLLFYCNIYPTTILSTALFEKFPVVLQLNVSTAPRIFLEILLWKFGMLEVKMLWNNQIVEHI